MATVLSRPVCLTRSTPFEAEAGSLCFYDVIRPSIVSRSSVLSCVLEADGDARLPDAVTLDKFKEYLQACRDDSFSLLSFEAMCGVIQVAHALDDTMTPEWVDIAAATLRCNLCYDHPDTVERTVISDMSAILQNLPKHILLLIFAASFRSLADLVQCFTCVPSDLHAAALEAAITPGKALHIPFAMNRNLHWFMKALASLPASPPSVESLTIEFETHRHNLRNLVPSSTHPIFWNVVQPHLVHALRHHTGLHSLSFPGLLVGSGTGAGEVMPAIASITSLQSLSFAADVDDLSSTTLAVSQHVRSALQSLPALVSLSLSLSRARSTWSTSKRPRVTSSQPPLCISSVLSSASTLTTLELHLDAACKAFTHSIQLTMPSLCKLVTNASVKLTAATISHLDAPLTSLELRCQDLPQDADYSYDDITESVQQLSTGLSGFSTLQHIKIQTANDIPLDHGRRLRCEVATHCRVTPYQATLQNALSRVSPSPLAPLHNLQSLELVTSGPVIGNWIQRLASTAVNLTRMRLSCGASNNASLESIDIHPGVDHSVFEALAALATVTQLEHLELAHALASPSSITLATLTPLVGLTALICQNWVPLKPADTAALACMTCLRHLELSRAVRYVVTMPPEMDQGAAAALVALPGLTFLSCADATFPMMLIDAARQHPAPGRPAWPALEHILLVITGDESGKHVLRGLGDVLKGMPSLRSVWIGLRKTSRRAAVVHDRIPEVEGLRTVCCSRGVTFETEQVQHF